MHLVGFITKKTVTIHGHMNVKDIFNYFISRFFILGTFRVLHRDTDKACNYIRGQRELLIHNPKIFEQLSNIYHF
jgi:hypothetical protein